MRYLYTPHLNLIHEISLHTTPEKKILNNTILMLTTLLIRKYQLLISETTEVEATGFTPAKKTSSSLDPEKTKISKKEQ
jgi:hypothetical protein